MKTTSTSVLNEARAIARRIVSGEIQPNEGCHQIGGLPGANDVEELDELTHLAHLQHGHEKVGFTAASLTKDIIKECEVLLEKRS
jgi:hypothetical protein